MSSSLVCVGDVKVWGSAGWSSVVDRGLSSRSTLLPPSGLWGDEVTKRTDDRTDGREPAEGEKMTKIEKSSYYGIYPAIYFDPQGFLVSLDDVLSVRTGAWVSVVSLPFSVEHAQDLRSMCSQSMTHGM